MKAHIAELALFGGTPVFAEKLHVGRPNIGDRAHFLARVNDMFDRRWLTNNGPYVQEFERKICELTGVRNAIVMCNATVALEIAIRALGLKGEVITPSFTFIATAHALQWQEITPVFCDVAPGTHHLDPTQIERLITPRTTGIMGVHVWGAACDTDAIATIAERHNLKVIYDAAHAFACSHNGTMIGNFGDAEVFSFHATKFLNSFEGGAVVTNNDELADKIRYMRNFGFAGYDDVDYVGTNGKMSEVCAAMGLTSLECLDDLIAVNRQNYASYRDGLKTVRGIKLFAYDESVHNNFQYIIAEIVEKQTGLSRDVLVKLLSAENILARRYFYPGCHQMEPYASFFPNAGLLLQETEALSTRVMSLPNGTSVNQGDIDSICELIAFIIENAPAITQLLFKL